MLDQWVGATVLGIVEGITEFLPVSSTGHLLLMDELLDFQGPPGHVFDIVIQLGAILAVVLVYFSRLWGVASTLQSKNSQHFVLAILLAFLPAVLIGVRTASRAMPSAPATCWRRARGSRSRTPIPMPRGGSCSATR